MNRIDEAFDRIDRANFLPEGVKSNKNVDAPLPIGYGQTSSQPSTVYLMLDWLDPQPDDKVLDVGSGSGWTTALLGYLVKPGGIVYAVEKVPELVEFGKNNCQNAAITNVEFFAASGNYGLPEFGPFDKILVSAAAKEIPNELLHQLKIGGRIVLPVKNSVWIINRANEQIYEYIEHPGFAFVPLVK